MRALVKVCRPLFESGVVAAFKRPDDKMRVRFPPFAIFGACGREVQGTGLISRHRCDPRKGAWLCGFNSRHAYCLEKDFGGSCA